MKKLKKILLLIVIISIGGCNQENPSVSNILIKGLENNELVDYPKLNTLLTNENYPYIIISDSMIENSNSWSVRSVDNQENVYRDLGTVSICINDDSDFIYSGKKYSFSEFDSIVENYLNEINNQGNEAIFQLFVLKNELTENEWGSILKCIKLFHSKITPSYSVIGFNQQCSTHIVLPPQKKPVLIEE